MIANAKVAKKGRDGELIMDEDNKIPRDRFGNGTRTNAGPAQPS
jgi:hypothetical protein